MLLPTQLSTFLRLCLRLHWQSVDTSPIKSKNRCELLDVKITENLFPISRSDFFVILWQVCSQTVHLVPHRSFNLFLSLIWDYYYYSLFISVVPLFEGFNFHRMVASVFIFTFGIGICLSITQQWGWFNTTFQQEILGITPQLWLCLSLFLKLKLIFNLITGTWVAQ